MLTTEQISKIFPSNKNIVLLTKSINSFLDKYNINTTNRIAGFLAQIGHESLDCTVLKENLNYSAVGLMKVFPRYFPNTTIANLYARNPEKIANRVYANRMSNGAEESGDGYKYRGRGAIQLTGKANYTLFANYILRTVDYTVSYLETLDGAIESAAWYFRVNGLNKYADLDDTDGMSDIINKGRKTELVGDAIGYADRLNRYNIAKSVIGNGKA